VFMAQKRSRRALAATSWEPVADWYVGWAGANGSEHHRRLAIPAVLELLAPIAGEYMLDLGCGPGVLAPDIARAGAHYTGVDLSARMLEVARRQHGKHGEFLLGDATRLNAMPELRANIKLNAIHASSASAWRSAEGRRLVVRGIP
jgi:ubiquinone/menaquinone biosynthesis C-methylase UbiE